MKHEIISCVKITDLKWLNLFKVHYVNSKSKICTWILASRKEVPYKDSNPDAVVIVATVNTPEGRKLVVTKEYRAPIDDYEYGFPAGLIDHGMTVDKTVAKELKEETGLDLISIGDKSNQIFSSAGLSDESVIIVFVEASGEISNEYQEDTEDIETFLYDINDIRELLASDKKVGAKGWGVLYYYSKIGKIE